jgi:hypothetical protein
MAQPESAPDPCRKPEEQAAEPAAAPRPGAAAAQQWLALARMGFMPAPVRRLAWREATRLHAQDDARSSAERDGRENTETRLPADENVRMPALWITELYTPTTVHGLLDGLRPFALKEPGQPAGLGIMHWVHQARRGGGFSDRRLPRVYDKRRSAGRFVGDGLLDRLPPGIDTVDVTLYAVTSSVTALVAYFQLDADAAQGLGQILNRDVPTRVTRYHGGMYVASSPFWLKWREIEAWRGGLREAAAAWLAQRLPGFFHSVGAQLPTLELLLTERQRPWDENAVREQWLDLLDLKEFDGYWRCEQVPGLRLRERMTMREGLQVHHLATLASTRAEFLEAFPGSSHGYGTDDLQAAVRMMRHHASDLSVRWALSAMVREVDQQLSALTDRAASASAGFGAARKLAKIHKDVVRIGLNGQVVVNDLLRLANGRGLWSYNVLDFTQVPPAYLPADETQAQMETATLLSTLRERQVHDGRRLTEIEADVRELLGIGADLRAASLNLNIQWIVALLALVSIGIAVWAAVKN